MSTSTTTLPVPATADPRVARALVALLAVACALRLALGAGALGFAVFATYNGYRTLYEGFDRHQRATDRAADPAVRRVVRE